VLRILNVHALSSRSSRERSARDLQSRMMEGQTLAELSKWTKKTSCALGGGIVESVSELTSLKRLSLRDSDVSGSIPESWTQLSELQIVDLSVN
jgi:hypothetical protein